MLFEGLLPNRSIETPEPPEKASWPVIAPFTPDVILRDESSKIRPTPILKMIEPAQRSVTAKMLSCESTATPIGAGTLSVKDDVTLCGLSL